MKIQVQSHPPKEKLEALQVDQWPIWTKEPSRFPWHYDSSETCYILEGEALVTPLGANESVRIREGDLVHFPAGLSCHWEVVRPIRKRYRLGASPAQEP
ncbi:cupin domain-containing protein [Candidatus Methylacidithermus pantelleriae]|nr:cupin domain-containing protein [Candidatus Methylacidithermus pantelleriae]